MSFRSTKTYGHELGLSAVFRQHRATSHCRHLHGYALSVTLTFGSDILDANGWVLDFGSLNTFKQWLVNQFDHKMLVAKDDPELESLLFLQTRDLASIIVVPATGCEAFASQIARAATDWLINTVDLAGRVWVHSVEVREHSANSAIWFNDRE